MKYKPCDKCNGDFEMVMIKNHLWESICETYEEIICDKCIEKRLGRRIEFNDLKEYDKSIIQCNRLWAISRNRLDILIKNKIYELD